jgi:hypothetical protein
MTTVPGLCSGSRPPQSPALITIPDIPAGGLPPIPT